jgi:hypothetical protein
VDGVSPQLVTPAHVIIAALGTAWPEWRISLGPVGTWQGYKCSADGRSRRVIVERSPAELDAAIRHAEGEPR